MLVKILIVAIIGYALYRMFVNDKDKKSDNAAKQQEERISSGELVKDPICGTYVEKDNSISVRNGEEIIHFCSYECRKKYIARIEEQNKLDN